MPYPPVSALQVAGAWEVTVAGLDAPFDLGDKVTFVGDGTFILSSKIGHMTVGSWRVRNFAPGRLGEDGMNAPLPPELELFTRGVRWTYVIEAGPRELRLSSKGADMVLSRA